jgi:hypothetical protein
MKGMPTNIGTDVEENIAGTNNGRQHPSKFRFEVPSEVNLTMHRFREIERQGNATKSTELHTRRLAVQQ